MRRWGQARQSWDIFAAGWAEIMIIDKVPLLGSGKPDFVAATKLAQERASVKREAA